MAATSYRYLFCDLLTNAILGELSVTGVNYQEKLNVDGTIGMHLLISGVDTAKLNVFNCTIPDKCAMYVDRNNVLVWGGVITGRIFDSKTQSLELAASEFLYYYGKRLITLDTLFSNVDQLTIARTLIQNASSVASGDIGLLYNTEVGGYSETMPVATSHVLVTQNYYGWENKTVFQAVQDLSKQNNGFDFTIDVYYDASGNPVRSFNTYYPRRGVAYSSTLASVPTFEMGGNMISYKYTEDGTKCANVVTAIGAGANSGKLIAIGTDATKLAAGWAVFEKVVNYPSVTDSTMLQNLATGEVNAVSYPPVSLVINVSPFKDPMFGTYECGDDVRIRITDPFFPSGYDGVWRIVALGVVAGEAQAETVILTLAQNTGV